MPTRPPRRRRPPRGLALLLVLGVVAWASVLCWALLAAASLRAHSDDAARAAAEGDYLAESGLSAALHLLKHPELSPVALVDGARGGKHFPGAANLLLWPGAPARVDLAVTQVGPTTYALAAECDARLANGTTLRRAATARVELPARASASLRPDVALLANGNLAVRPADKIEGGLTISGALSGTTGAVKGLLTAVSGGTRAAPSGTVPVPKSAQIKLLVDAGSGAVTYTHLGAKRTAERVPTHGTVPTGKRAPAHNPLNVWYSSAAVTLPAGEFWGTLVITGSAGHAHVAGDSKVYRPSASSLPVLVAPRLTFANSSSAKLYVGEQGAVWLAGGVTGGGSGSELKVDGALMLNGDAAANAPSPRAGFNGKLELVAYPRALADFTYVGAAPEPVLTGWAVAAGE